MTLNMILVLGYDRVMYVLNFWIEYLEYLAYLYVVLFYLNLLLLISSLEQDGILIFK
jgi:hypothetical protein